MKTMTKKDYITEIEELMATIQSNDTDKDTLKALCILAKHLGNRNIKYAKKQQLMDIVEDLTSLL